MKLPRKIKKTIKKDTAIKRFDKDVMQVLGKVFSKWKTEKRNNF